MTWSAPATWTTDQVVTAADLNQELRDNLIALKDPPSDNYELNEGADDTTSSTSFGDVDATNFALTIITTGGDVMVNLAGASIDNATGSARTFFDIDVDGVRAGGDDGIARIEQGTSGGANVNMLVSFSYLITGLAAASHTFKLQWKVSAGTSKLFAGAGTSNADVHPQFFAREIS